MIDSPQDAYRAPRYHARILPRPSRRALGARGLAIVASAVHRLWWVLFRQLAHLRKGALPASVFAKPLRLMFEDLGGTFIKFGQIIASSPGLFGEELANEFRSCLDTGPSVPYEAVRRVIEDDLGMTLEEAFASFNPVAIGQASIAVVHRATL
ncbi:MAG: AarF/UbiB family protein, partial [Actinomycetota bacterium]